MSGKEEVKVEVVKEEVETAGISEAMKKDIESIIEEDSKAGKEPDEIVDDKKKKEEKKEEVKEEVKTDLPDPDPSSESEEDETGGKSPEEEKTVEETEEVEISDDLMTRAVQAGMSVSDAKAIKNATALENVCKTLEAARKTEPTEEEAAAAAKAKEESVDDIFKDLPTLDPEEYDENLVKLVDGLKGIILSQNTQIAANKAEKGNAEANFVDTQINALGPEFVERIGVTGKVVADSPQAKTRDAVRAKFDVLKAGYEATKTEVDQTVVFSEAVGMVMGDVVATSKDAATIAALEKRGKHSTAKPGSGKVKAPNPSAADAAEEALDKKYPQNKK